MWVGGAGIGSGDGMGGRGEWDNRREGRGVKEGTNRVQEEIEVVVMVSI